jgi:hypothetical protein
MPNNEDAVLVELQALKKLMILDLLGKGYSQGQLGLTLGINQASISRMFPKGVLTKGKIKREASS